MNQSELLNLWGGIGTLTYCNWNRFKRIILLVIWDALRDMGPFVQLKKREKHPLTTDTFRKILLKVSLLPGCFSLLLILSCTNGSKSRKASHFTFCSRGRKNSTKRMKDFTLAKLLRRQTCKRFVYIHVSMRCSR